MRCHPKNSKSKNATVKPYNNQNESSKTEQVRQMFNAIAPKYDLLNRLLSMGIDKLWRKKVVRMVSKNNPSAILDMACGTGDLTIALAKALPHAKITGMDLSQEMLEVANQKINARNINIDLVTAQAEILPLPLNSFDAVTCAFGVRNFTDIPQALNNMYDVLKSGQHLYILEFSIPPNNLLSRLFRYYFHTILPAIGGLISGDRKAYTYLPLSVDEFPSGKNFVSLLEQAHFQNCTITTMTMGIVTIYTATK